MTELTSVKISTAALPPAGDRSVVFHGVNKTGSLAMSNVIRASYEAAGRADQFFSLYHRAPADHDLLAQAMRDTDGHAFFVGHYIYRRLSPPPDALLVSQIRHPLPRTLSAYGWIKRKHLLRHGTLDGFPSLGDWAQNTRGKVHTQMVQFALGFTEDKEMRTARMSPQELCARGLENLHNDFAWFGCAELFEESIFAMAHICGLEAVPPWERDTRNEGRQRLEDTDQKTLDIINEVFACEFEFYEQALATLRARLDRIDFGSSITGYRAQCLAEYGERLTLPC